MHRQANVQIHLGDCLSVLQKMESGVVNLAYLDPPFFTQKVHSLAPRDRSREFSFDDLWSSQKAYATFLFERLCEIRRVLADDGSVFFHCDRNAVHLVRALLDEVFGSQNFRSEIIWHYRRWSNSQRGLLPAHQTILYFTQSDDYTFNEVWTEYSPATNVDQILQRRSRDDSNKSVYARDEQGNVISNGAKRGVPLGDVWDIPFLNPKAKERTGYPTQKPLLLMERIISLVTKEGDCVLDPFCGSGTTLVAAQLLNRTAIGIDLSEDAVELVKKRLAEPTMSQSRLLDVGREAYRNADDNALAILQGVDFVPVQRNAGIDAILKQDFAGGPVTVLVQRPGETLLEAARKLSKASASKGAKLMFLIALAKGGSFGFADELPIGVVVIESPALGIREHLNKLRGSEVLVSKAAV
ncbi:MAG: site-specific DNA-methyltransferase [Acidobacteria bacterium]|nr:site-specific DNA-methyltransferase [Acidobacteriota bacterium]